jgi:hypothetical protein
MLTAIRAGYPSTLVDRVNREDLECLEAEPPSRCASAPGLSLRAKVAVPARHLGFGDLPLIEV